jgi:hypothetical protein
MSKSLTGRERVLLVILAVVLVGAVYFMAIWRPTAETISTAEASMTALTESITKEEETATEIASMKAALDTVIGQPESRVITPVYDNATALLRELNPIFADITYGLHVSFSDPSFPNEGDGVATRTLQLSFNTETYLQARNIVLDIADGRFRNDIKSLTMTPWDYSYLHRDEIIDNIDVVQDLYIGITVNMTVDYYEIYHDPTPPLAEGE